MIGLDTNVLVRYLTQDEPKQAAVANKLIEKKLSPQDPGVITLVTLIELVWVLESCYDQSKSAIDSIIHELLTTRQLLVENPEAVYHALNKFAEGTADFSDALIVAVAEQIGCQSVVSFDKRAQTVGMTLI